MSLHIAGHNGIYLHTIIEGHIALSIDFHLGYILDPCHCWKGSGFKKGICVCCSMPWVLPLGASLAWLLSSEGPRLPSTVHPWFKWEFVLNAFTKGQSRMKQSKLLQ